MGQHQSNSSDSEVNNEADTLIEQPNQGNSYRRGGKNIPAKHNESSLPNHGRFSKTSSGTTNGKISNGLQSDKKLEEKNNSERIIREKEKLLKEKEETIRTQAKLIRTQNELLQHRKLMNSSNVGTSKVQYDLVFKPHVTDTSGSSSFKDNHANAESNSQKQMISIQNNADADFGNQYFIERNKIVNHMVPPQPDRLNQAFNASSSVYTDPQNNNSTVGIPFQHKSRNANISYHYSTSHFNVPPPNLHESFPKHNTTMPVRVGQNKEVRKNNIRKEERLKEGSTNEILRDLEIQTNFELLKLNVVQNGAGTSSNADANKNLNDRKTKQGKVILGIFKCSRCSITWKSKISYIGASQTCRRCGSNVCSKIMDRNWKDERENRGQNILNSKSEKIAYVD